MGLTHKQKRMLIRIIASVVLLAVDMVVSHILSLPKAVLIVIYLIPFAVAGYDVVWKAIRNIGHGQVFDENFLMTIATIGAMIIGEYSEGAAVMLFYQVGELFQSIATARSRRSVAELMDIRPDSAVVLRDGKRLQVHPSEVEVGELIEIRAGEKVPIDAVVVEGVSSLDTAALTGESMPRDVGVGSETLSGSVNLSGNIVCRTTKLFGESTASKILELVENASSKKARAESFITRFARIYTPCVVAAAVLVAVIVPLITGDEFIKWITRALNFLVVSCPCALVISVPMSFFGGIGGASRQGILVKGGNYMETLSKVSTVIFDKTGTLTKGEIEVSRVNPVDCSERELIEAAAAAESGSNHPIAQSLVRYAGDIGLTIPDVSEYREIAGKGVECVLLGEKICAGNTRLMEQEGLALDNDKSHGTSVHIMRNGKYLGFVEISDKPKEDSSRTISKLGQMGIRTVILTGDGKETGEAVGKLLGVDRVYTELLPENKVEIAEQIISSSEKGSTVFVGDGINDAPVLSRADVGIAMGAAGSDAAIEAADIVIMDDKPSGIIKAIKISRKTLRIVYQNIWFALIVKAVVLVTSAVGVTNMWAAVFADVGVAIIAVLNAMRALSTQKD